MITRHHITGVILCGGGASRMGGINKPLVELAGRPLVQHVRERLAPQVSSIVISANDDRIRYAEWGDVVVADNTSRRGGPLVGLSSALAVVNTPYVFCCPGDAPLLDGGLVARLAAALGADEAGDEKELSKSGEAEEAGEAENAENAENAANAANADAVIPFDGLQPQHLFLLMRTSTVLVESLHDYLSKGARSVHGWLTTVRTVTVNASDIANSFTNINTSSDLAHIAAAMTVAPNSQHSTERL